MDTILSAASPWPTTASSVIREFPAAAPAELSAELTSLESLVHHAESVDGAVTLERVQRAFQMRRVEFMAVLHHDRVIGLCSRGQLGFIMSSRFGFALYSQQPIAGMMVDHPLIIVEGTPVRQVLDLALARRGAEFHEDVVLVDREARLVGLLKVETLAQLQSRLVSEQLSELQQQHAQLQQRNLELFRANHAARQSQSLYLSLFENHALGVALVDATGAVHEHNRRFAELLNGRPEPLAVASLAAWLVPAERAAFLALLESRIHGESSAATHEFSIVVPERGERRFRCSTGWVQATGQIVICLDDVTEQRALERTVLRQEKQRLLDTLVGGIAHELNNKLTPVQGFAELLTWGPESRNHEYGELIVRSVGEAARIIRQLLDFSKPATAVFQSVDLRGVIDETLAMTRFQFREADCEVQSVLPAGPIWVTADSAQLKQVVLNLVLNALHALEGRPDPRLVIELERTDRIARIVIADNGCGIPPENLGRIFDPFFTTKGPERGSGLGLSICFSVVRQHGGEIAVESQPGAGAKFTVSLPADAGAPPVLLPAAEESSSEPSAVPRGERVLVVEDDVVLRRLMQEVLSTRFGCRVDIAEDGLTALALLERGDYALILSDIRMPNMDGTGLYLRLRELRPALAQRVVFVTGHPGDPRLEAEIASWNVPVIAKPFSLSRLSEVCRPYLAASNQASA